MRRTVPAIILALLALLAVAAAVRSDDPKPADDLAALQGVWETPADAKGQLQFIVIGDRAGYQTANPGAQPPLTTSSSVVISPAAVVDAGGKKAVEITVGKDYKTRVGFRPADGGYVFDISGAEYTAKRVNTRAADDPRAKALEGTWVVTAAEADGKPVPGDGWLAEVVFTADRYALKGPGGKELLSSYYRLLPTKDKGDAGPAGMDWWGPRPGFLIPLVYEQRGDTLRLAHPPLQQVNKGGAKRPAGFDTAGAEVIAFTLTRAKPKK